MSPVAEETGLDRAAFERFEAGRPASEAPWIRARRREGWARFEEMGFPTTRLEDWRHTSVAAIVRTPFQRAEGGARVRPEELDSLTFHRAFEGHLLVFVDGRYAAELSSVRKEQGLVVRSLAKALHAADPDLPPVLASDLHTAFAALNTAFLEDGALVTTSPGVVVKDPVQVVYFSTGGLPATVSHPRTVLRAGRGSQLTLVESYGGRPEATYFTNAVTRVILEDAAIVDHYKVQRESEGAFHVAETEVTQGRDSRWSSTAITLGGALSRDDVRQAFAGEGGECVLNGLFMPRGSQHMDTHTWVDHAFPHCSTRELYKGILDGRARGVFVGRILVRKDAQKTDAHQTNKNLLLSREALVQSVPQLEILADDVKCKHGSTTGQLDPAALFYLRSRGIGEEAARSLMTCAFASDVAARIRVDALRKGLEEHLRARLPAAPDIQEAVVARA